MVQCVKKNETFVYLEAHTFTIIMFQFLSPS